MAAQVLVRAWARTSTGSASRSSSSSATRPRRPALQETGGRWEAGRGVTGMGPGLRVVGSPAQLGEMITRLRSIDDRLAAIERHLGIARGRVGQSPRQTPALRKSPARLRRRPAGRLTARRPAAGKIRPVPGVAARPLPSKQPP